LNDNKILTTTNYSQNKKLKKCKKKNGTFIPEVHAFYSLMTSRASRALHEKKMPELMHVENPLFLFFSFLHLFYFVYFFCG
jgi:hypothetical protein